MSSAPTTIRELTQATDLWNPSNAAGQTAEYIDVSAVSRDDLTIHDAATLPIEKLPSRARKLVRTGDTIFATIRPGLRRVAMVPAQLDGAIASTAFCILRPDPDKVDPLFLFFAVSWEQFVERVAALQTGASYPAVRDRDVLDQELELPDPVDQRSIGLCLDAVWQAVLTEGQAAGQAEVLKRAAMRELFTRGLRGEEQRETEIGLVPASWDVAPFEDLREWLQYGTSTRCTTEPAEYPVLRIPNVAPGRIDATELKYCDLSRREAERYLLERGDILFIRTNGVVERLGACAVYSGSPASALFASYLIRARLKTARISPHFAAYYFESDRGTQEVTSRATPAADGKFNLNTSAIDSFRLPVPQSLDEQREIVEILDAIDQKIDLHKRKKAVLEELFKALLHKLMTGEIRVADLDLTALHVQSGIKNIDTEAMGVEDAPNGY